jgi:hypothetical protein
VVTPLGATPPAAAEIERLRAALLACARQAEALKRDCGTDPESSQAVRNAQYQSISTAAHIALGTIRGPAPPAAAEPQQMGTVLINGHRYRRPVITVAVVTHDGASCVVPVHELVDLIGEGTEYTVQIKTMRLAEFERMPEFGGW